MTPEMTIKKVARTLAYFIASIVCACAALLSLLVTHPLMLFMAIFWAVIALIFWFLAFPQKKVSNYED